MSVQDDVRGLRDDVSELQNQVGRLDERLAAHAHLSDERHKMLGERLDTAQGAIVRQITQFEASLQAQSQERTRQLTILAGVITTLITAIAGVYGVRTINHHEPTAPPQVQSADQAPG